MDDATRVHKGEARECVVKHAARQLSSAVGIRRWVGLRQPKRCAQVAPAGIAALQEGLAA